MKGNVQLIKKMVNSPYYNDTSEWERIKNDIGAIVSITDCPFCCRFFERIEFQKTNKKRPTKVYAEVNIYEDNVVMKLSHDKPKTLTPELVNEINKWQLNVLDVCIKNKLITIDESEVEECDYS